MSSTSTVATVRPFIAGEWREGEGQTTVLNKFTGEPETVVSDASRAQVSEAVAAVAEGQRRVRWDNADRYRVLAAASALVDDRRDLLIDTIVDDAGFTIGDAAREVDRAAQTLLLSGEEAKRLAGEVVPLHGAAGQQRRIGLTTYHPLGVVCAITPFNSPLNTVAHKVGPALAAGNGIVLKPASQTPRTADMLLGILLDAGLPPELISVLYGDGHTVGQWLLEDERIAFYAFTGSTAVGKHIQRTVGLRRTQLEMGSLSSTIICADADLDRCVGLVANAGFRKAGQVCTSIQRLYVEQSVADDVAARLAADLATKAAGDPHDPSTFVGPVISPDDAVRVSGWVDEAVNGGANVAVGGTRRGNVIEPTVLVGVDPSMRVMSQEIFGPVVVTRVFDDLDRAISEINNTPYGLAAGIFTANLDRALDAAHSLRMGSVHINETSSSRVDLMPYSGVKESGLGLEGPRYAICEMSEQRLITIGRTSG
jgi:succinate-semialdehyde dehydrogenase/glutarate-semialdehyde dehydrogenase